MARAAFAKAQAAGLPDLEDRGVQRDTQVASEYPVHEAAANHGGGSASFDEIREDLAESGKTQHS